MIQTAVYALLREKHYSAGNNYFRKNVSGRIHSFDFDWISSLRTGLQPLLDFGEAGLTDGCTGERMRD